MRQKLQRSQFVIGIALLGGLAMIGHFQYVAFGDPSKNGGTIEGTLVDAEITEKQAAVVFISQSSEPLPEPKNKGGMSQKKITFHPHVLAVMVGTTIECPNDDTVTHNIFSPSRSAKPFNFGLYPPGSKKEIVAGKPGVIPFMCNIHSEMGAFCVVCPNQFFAKTDEKGKFSIGQVPAGTYKVTFWHEKLKPKSVEVTVTAGAVANAEFGGLEKGKYSIDLAK